MKRRKSESKRKRPASAAAARRLQLQPLEERRLLVATVSVSVAEPVAVPEAPSEQIVYTFSRDESDDLLAVQFELSGDALFDVDYTTDETRRDTIWLPEEAPESGPTIGTATFYPGQSTVELVVLPKSDALTEFDEDVIVSVVEADDFGPVSGAASLIVRREPTAYFTVDAENRLGTVDVQTGIVNVIGSIDSTQPITDIAITEDGDLFAISLNNLYVVHLDLADQASIPSTLIGPHGIFNANALIDARDNDFGSQSGDLFIVGMNALDLHLIDIELSDQQFSIDTVTTVFDIDGALANLLLPSDYVSSGDLDYLSGGRLILSAFRPSDDFDSLIEIHTPTNSGSIQNAPTPTEDPGELFTGVRGLAFDQNDSYAFSEHTLLEVNQFNRDSSRAIEMTGRPYDVSVDSTATGTILGDPADPPIITLNAGQSDATDPNQGSPPTSWAIQRSAIDNIHVQLGAIIDSVAMEDIRLINLGTDGSETPFEISLRSNQINFQPPSDTMQIDLDPNQLPNGKYRLELPRRITNGPDFSFEGNRDNRFFVLSGDWDGNAHVDLRDVATFAYWVGSNVGPAPAYVDLNGSGSITEADFHLMEANLAASVLLPGIAPTVDPAWIDPSNFETALQSALNPLDVNGSTQVSPLDALNVINRLASDFTTITDWRYDVNRDGLLSPRDALRVINFLALQAPTGTSFDTESLQRYAIDLNQNASQRDPKEAEELDSFIALADDFFATF